ncbi:MAG: PAS domain S-box-containing protein [Planctomycetota bacterium]|jgi:PAS domain S-box-containing protein
MSGIRNHPPSRISKTASNAELRAVAARYADLYDSAPVGYFTLLRDSEITLANRAGAQLLNRDSALLMGQLFKTYVGQSFRPVFDAFLRRVFLDASLSGCEVDLEQEGQSPQTVHIEAALSPDGLECRAVIRDVTKQSRALRALTHREKELETLIEHTPICVHEIDLVGRFESVNRAGLEMLGLDREEQIRGQGYLDRVCKGDLPRIRELLQRAIEGESGHFEFTSSSKQPLIIKSCFIPILDDEGSTLRLLGISEDITERRRAEDTIRISTQLLEASQSIGKLGGWELNLATKNLYWTAETYRIHDTTPEQFDPTVDAGVGYFLPESRLLLTNALEAATERGEGYDLELETLTTSGRRIDVRTTCAVTMKDGRPSKLTGIFQDITERKRAEVALKDNQAELQMAIHAANIGPWHWDLVTDEFYFSPEWKRQIGYEDHEFTNVFSEWVDHMHPDDREPILHAVQAFREDPSKGYSVDFRFRHKDGSYRWIHTRALLLLDSEGQPARLLGAHIDFTERKSAEDQLLRSQRMESLGTLAGGVAHDLNNALAPILMGVELLRMEHPGAGETVDLLESSAKRGADMVRQLLTFAKGAKGGRTPVRIGSLIKEVYGLMRGTFPKNIVLHTDFSPTLPSVLGDTTQLHRILLNLCVNARDAMPDGGNLSINASVKEIGPIDAESPKQAMPGTYIQIEVRDTGLGIPPEILDRIMDPFFTTKGPHEGTGLGLSTVLGLVQGHDGFLQVDSQTGIGTSFKIYLPTKGATNDPAIHSEQKCLFTGNGEVILFVDDEPNVRKIASMILQRMNFKPLTAMDGADGLLKALDSQDELHAIVLDLHMPTMDGLEFARSVRKFLPHIPILVSSGRMDLETASEFRSLGITDFLDKPFTEERFKQAMEQLLRIKSGQS